MPELRQGDIFAVGSSEDFKLSLIFGHVGFNYMRAAWNDFAKKFPTLSAIDNPFTQIVGPLQYHPNRWVWFVEDGSGHGGLADAQLFEVLRAVFDWVNENNIDRIITNGVRDVAAEGNSAIEVGALHDRRARQLIDFAAEKEVELSASIALISLNDVFVRNSEIPQNTIRAYLETNYHVYGDMPMTLIVGERNPLLAALHEEMRVECSAFITAYNPFSEKCDPEANVDRQEALASDLRSRGLMFVDGGGQHPSNNWPAEPSFLVLGLPLADAKALGRKYRQNAIIWVGADAVPQLKLLR